MSYHSKAIVLHNLRRYKQALAACGAALALEPHYQPAQVREMRIMNDIQ